MHGYGGASTEEQRRRKTARSTNITTRNGVEEHCASAASDAEKLVSGEAAKLRGWERLERWEAATGWKAGTSVYHSPFIVDVYTHSQLVQQNSTAIIGSGNGNLFGCGDVDALSAIVDVESRFRAKPCSIDSSLLPARGGCSRN